MENKGRLVEMVDPTDLKPSPRHPVELTWEFKRNYARQTDKAEVANLSLTGAFLKTQTPLQPQEKINVYMTVQGRRRKVAAKVVWCRETGAGIKFQHFNNRDLQIVDDILYYATEKSSSSKDILESIIKKVA